MAFWSPVGLQPEPKASSEPIDKRSVFSKSWYLFLNSLQMAVATILAALQQFWGTGPIITDTHANKTALDASGKLLYDPNKFQRFAYLETDRRLTYVSQQPAGTVTTVGTAVTWVSGQLFSALWVGKTINIGKMPFVVSAVGSSTGLTLTASAGTIASPIAFAVQQFYWLYSDGIMDVTLLAGLPGDLAIEDAGVIVGEDQYQHSYTWNGTGYQFSKQDDHLAGQMMPSAGGGTPLAGVWQVCNGSTVNVSKGDGTVVSVTTTVLNSGSFIYGAAAETAATSGTPPTWQAGAKTDTGGAHTHTIGQGSVLAGTGASTVIDNATPTGTNTTFALNLSNTNAKLNIPSLANGGLPQNIGLVFYMRQ